MINNLKVIDLFEDDILNLFVYQDRYEHRPLARLMASYALSAAEIQETGARDVLHYKSSLATLVELADLYGLLLTHYPPYDEFDLDGPEENWIKCPFNEDITEWFIIRAKSWRNHAAV